MTSDPLAVIAALPGVAEEIIGARDRVDRLLAHRVLRLRSATVAAEAAMRGARASAALEGIDWPLEAVRGFAAGRSAGVEGAPVIRAALRLSAAAPAAVATWRRAPLQALAHLHLVAASGVVPADVLGRPRSGDGVAERLVALGELAGSAGPSSALVLAAVAHGELATLRPFGWGDALIARALARVVLLDRGFDRAGVVVPDVGHGELGRDAYESARAGYAAGCAAGVAAWVGHVARAVAAAALDSLAVCEALTRAG